LSSSSVGTDPGLLDAVAVPCNDFVVVEGDYSSGDSVVVEGDHSSGDSVVVEGEYSSGILYLVVMLQY
jgi:hypothetical protein